LAIKLDGEYSHISVEIVKLVGQVSNKYVQKDKVHMALNLEVIILISKVKLNGVFIYPKIYLYQNQHLYSALEQLFLEPYSKVSKLVMK